MAATELQFGTAKIFGLEGTTITGVVTFTFESINAEFGGDLTEFKNQNGDVETMIISAQSVIVDVTFEPNGATRAAALTSLATLTTKGAGGVITISGCAVTALNLSYNILPPISIKMSRDGIAVASFKAKSNANASGLAKITG